MFVFSTDFCHWGSSFDYQPFKDKGSEIHKFIEEMDRRGAKLIFEKKAEEFRNYLSSTKNTICGREVMRVLIQLSLYSEDAFEELQYAQSNNVKKSSEKSVSYLSAALYK